jgi:nicotinate phosphoribosyltransferase
LDTYDTEAAARKVVALAPRLRAAGIKVGGVRLDSGDLATLARSVRLVLDEGGLTEVAIFASGGLDEDDLVEFAKRNAPIDGYGLGTSLVTSSDAPALDCAYKLEEYGGVARRKRSSGKATWPGRKQVWRSYGTDGRMAGDVLSIEGDHQAGEPLLQPVMRGGQRIIPPPSLAEVRSRTAHELQRLPDRLRRLEPGAVYPVQVARGLVDLAEEVDRQARPATGPNMTDTSGIPGRLGLRLLRSMVRRRRRRLGFEAVILEDACRSINIEGSAAARSRLQAIGALCVASGALG